MGGLVSGLESGSIFAFYLAVPWINSVKLGQIYIIDFRG